MNHYGIELLKKCVSSGLLPQESYDSCKQLIELHLGKNEFQSEFKNLLQNNSYWDESRGAIEDFICLFELCGITGQDIEHPSEKNQMKNKKIGDWPFVCQYNED